MATARSNRNNRDGAILPILAVMIVLLFIAAVFSIDLARIHVVRSELRTATDAASRAAVEALGRTEDRQVAIDTAVRVASQNLVAGEPLTLDTSKIEFGTARELPDGSFEFVPQNSRVINTVRVVGERIDGSPDGPVNMLFGSLLGQSNFQPVQVATSTRLDRDITLVLDKSGSMNSSGRFQALRNGVAVFLSEVQKTDNVRVSLVVYDSQATKLLNLTNNLPQVQAQLDRVRPGGFTGIGRGLQLGLDSVQNDPLARSFALKSVIVMTDGRHNRGVSPDVVARNASNLDIDIHTITFSNGANQNLMREVARLGNGTHLHAASNNELVEAFQTIARQIKVVLIE